MVALATCVKEDLWKAQAHLKDAIVGAIRHFERETGVSVADVTPCHTRRDLQIDPEATTVTIAYSLEAK